MGEMNGHVILLIVVILIIFIISIPLIFLLKSKIVVMRARRFNNKSAMINDKDLNDIDNDIELIREYRKKWLDRLTLCETKLAELDKKEKELLEAKVTELNYKSEIEKYKQNIDIVDNLLTEEINSYLKKDE